jgi:hypothetical protein
MFAALGLAAIPQGNLIYDSFSYVRAKGARGGGNMWLAVLLVYRCDYTLWLY